MKYLKLIFFSFFLLSATVITQAQGDFSVYVFIAEKCPISIYMAQPLQEAYKQFGDQVDFYAVFPMQNSTENSAKKFLDEYGLSAFNIKLDNDQGFSKKLGATITPEVVVLNGIGEVVYRGRISDAYRAPGKMKHGPRKNEMKQVLESLSLGEIVPKPWSNAVGCYITFH
jgi:thiol-disulfide isomerase/thioredoxin